MDDVWLCVDEDDNSSESFNYSDKVDSEIEAELYGMIHHQEKLCNEAPYKKDFDSDKSLEISDLINSQTEDASCNESNNIESNCSLKSLSKSLNQSNKSRFKKNLHSCSTPLKRNSDSEYYSHSVILSSEQDSGNAIKLSEDSEAKYSKLPPEFMSPKENVYENFPIKNVLNKKNAVVLDSSDSDESIIWIETDNTVNNDLQTNLSHDVDTVSISSDSDISVGDSSQLKRKKMVSKNASLVLTNKKIRENSEDNLVVNSDSSSIKLLRLRTGEIIQKHASLPNGRIEDDFKELWYIDDEDRYRSKKRYRRLRYHMPNDKTCSNCGEKGHLAKSCTVPKEMKCFVCAGAHTGSECPNRMCGKCYQIGHDSRFCWMKFNGFCNHCNMKGHIKKDCPDIWRRYHLTTEPVTIVAGRPLNQDKTVYCFNCGWAGHFGSICQEPRRGPSTWPCVVSYTDPDDMLIQRIDHQRNADKMDFHQNQRNSKYKDVHHIQRNRNFMDVHHNQRNINFMDVHQNQRHMNLIDVHHNQRNMDFNCSDQNEERHLNTLQDLIPERRNGEKKLKKWQIFKQRAIARKKKDIALREKDFPRTAKTAKIEKYKEGVPESVELVLNNQLKKRKRNRGRKRSKQLKLSGNN